MGVFDPQLEGRRLSFSVRDGRIVDSETGSEWNLLGEAESGPLEGGTLTPVVHRSQFWFSWVVYKPDTILYLGGGQTSRVLPPEK